MPMTEVSNEISISEEDPRRGDASALCDEMAEFVLCTYPEDAENGVIPSTREDLATKGMFVVARLDGWAVGTAAVLAHEPVDSLVTMEVKSMYVREKARGRRVAEQMLRWLELMARIRGTQKLVLQCGPRQPEALRLYERCGYSVRSAYGKHNDHPLSIFFEKRL
jgi:putative acetyltransferase